MSKEVRAIIVDGTEIMTSYTAVEIADRLRTYDDLKEEIERLNNIINELEESIKRSYYKYTGEQINALQDVLDKLKELKESGNNE